MKTKGQCVVKEDKNERGAPLSWGVRQRREIETPSRKLNAIQCPPSPTTNCHFLTAGTDQHMRMGALIGSEDSRSAKPSLMTWYFDCT